MNFSLSSFAPEKLVWRDGFGSPDNFLSSRSCCLCSLRSHLNVLTFFPPDGGLLRRSRCVQNFLGTTTTMWLAYTVVYVCMYVWSSHITRVRINPSQAESGAYLRDSSRFPRRRPFIYVEPPYAIGSVPSLSGHSIPYRWRSLLRVHRHRASKPQGSFKRVLPWQVTMDQLICASLSHTHYWYGVGMLKVP